MGQHDKIINNVSKRILAPEGLFRKGQSRIWLDDNGFFMVMVEYQPSSWSKGTYLNVGVSFLWDLFDEIEDVSRFNYGYRVLNHTQYRGNDLKFEQAVEKYAFTALEKVKEYRKFQDYSYSKICLEEQAKERDRTYLDLAMLEYFYANAEAGNKYFLTYMEKRKQFLVENNLWKDNSLKLFSEYQRIIEHCSSDEKAQTMMIENIKKNRERISARASYKKMNKDWTW